MRMAMSFGKIVLHNKCNTQVFMVKDPVTGETVFYCPGHDCRHDVGTHELHLEPENPEMPIIHSRFDHAW
jgi:hypothetical protein